MNDQPAPLLLGRLSVLAAAVLWSTSGLFAKQDLFTVWPEATRGALLAFWRALFAALILLPFVRRPRWNWRLLPLGACFVAMNVSYLTSMTRTTAGNAIWLQAVYPWWVLLFSVAFFRQPVARRDLVPLAFGALGVALILAMEFRHGGNLVGVVSGLASGLFYAGVVVLMWRLREEDSAFLVALNHAVAALFLLPVVVYLDQWPSGRQLSVLAGFGILQMAIPYLFLARGLRTVGSQEAAVIGLAEPMLVPLWVYWVGLETPAWWTIAGATLIFVGLLLRYVVLGRLGRRRP